jgi:hypothetical protein
LKIFVAKLFSSFSNATHEQGQISKINRAISIDVAKPTQNKFLTNR